MSSRAHPDDGYAYDGCDGPGCRAARGAALPVSHKPIHPDLRTAAIEYVSAHRAYNEALDSHKGWSDEEKQAALDRDPEAWFAPWDRVQAASERLGVAVDAALRVSEDGS